jgi:hypothetical protein
MLLAGEQELAGMEHKLAQAAGAWSKQRRPSHGSRQLALCFTCETCIRPAAEWLQHRPGSAASCSVAALRKFCWLPSWATYNCTADVVLVPFVYSQ